VTVQIHILSDSTLSFLFLFSFEFHNGRKAESFLAYYQIFSYLLTPSNPKNIDNVYASVRSRNLCLFCSSLCSEQDVSVRAALSSHQGSYFSDRSLLGADTIESFRWMTTFLRKLFF
jgi:hypothetical protein